jgi:serine protease Do
VIASRSVAVAFVLAVLPVTAAADDPAAFDAAAGSLDSRIRAARDAVAPALVHIRPVFETFDRGKKERATAAGSGVIVSADGLVVTNYHVAGRGEDLLCTLSDRRRRKAKRIGGDPMTDLAVLRLEREPGDPESFPFARFGDSERLEVGDWVIALGSPFALSRSLSLGVVSCKDRYLDPTELLDPDVETGTYNTWIQTDAAINPGNSGGPLVDLSGRIVGINARKIVEADNVGFSIPASLVVEVYSALLAHGSVPRSSLGIRCQPIGPELWSRFGREGVLIADVEPHGPGDRAGLRPGDVLLSCAGVALSASFDEEIPDVRRFLASLPAGEAVDLAVSRGGETLLVKAAAEPEDDRALVDVESRLLGVTVRAVTESVARTRMLPEAGGFLVTGVTLGGVASEAEPEIEVGDVILGLGLDFSAPPASEFAALEAALVAAAAGDGRATVRVRRKSGVLAASVAPRGLPAAEPDGEGNR